MNIFSGDFINSVADLIKAALRKAVKEILEEQTEEKFLLTREEIAQAIGCSVDTFDATYRYQAGFPYHKKGNTEAWNKKEVFEFLHKNQLKK